MGMVRVSVSLACDADKIIMNNLKCLETVPAHKRGTNYIKPIKICRWQACHWQDLTNMIFCLVKK
jgi:hypothetical protein